MRSSILRSYVTIALIPTIRAAGTRLACSLRQDPERVDCPLLGVVAAIDELFCIIGLRRTMRELEMLSTVALLEDVATTPLRRGQVGTIVEHLAPGVYEVEFSDDEGRAYAIAPCGGTGLLVLRYIREMA